MLNYYAWPYRLTVRTSAFHADNRGSIPRGVTKARSVKEVDCSTSFRFCEDGACRKATASRGREHLVNKELAPHLLSDS